MGRTVAQEVIVATPLGAPEGHELTAANRFADEVVTLRRDVAAEVVKTWATTAAVADFAAYSQQLVRSIEPTYQAATLAALEMVFDIIAQTGGRPAPSWILQTPTDRLIRVIESTGPELIRSFEDKGATREAAEAMALRRTSLAVQQIMTDTANFQAQETVGKNLHILQAHGRKAEPNACAFCKRLAGGAARRPVYNVTAKWYRPHPNCHCTLIPLGRYRQVRIRTATEIAAGRAMHKQIKDAKDRQMARSGQASGRVSGGYPGAERLALPDGFRPVRIA